MLSVRTDKTEALQNPPVRVVTTWEQVSEELFALTKAYCKHRSSILFYRLDAALRHAETYIKEPGFATFARLSPEELTALYKKNNDRREFLDRCHINILKNETAWENFRKTCEATYSRYESRDKLNKKLEKTLDDAECLIIDEEEIKTKIKSPAIRQAALVEMNARRNFIDAYRANLLNNQKIVWENSWNTISQCAMAYAKSNTRGNLNSLKLALNKAEPFIPSNAQIAKINSPDKRKVLFEEMKQRRTFIAANRIMVAQSEKTAFSWCRLFASKLFDRKPKDIQNLRLESVVAAPSIG
jgi:hypothetical protein